jgi:hypothetical protein
MFSTRMYMKGHLTLGRDRLQKSQLPIPYGWYMPYLTADEVRLVLPFTERV